MTSRWYFAVARIALLGLFLALSACVYLRLLELKNQLAEFDKNFRVEKTDHFIVHFLHPVLLRDDFVELSKMEPSKTESTTTGKRSVQTYRKLDDSGKLQPGLDIVFTLDFNKDDKLTTWDFSPSFLAIAPAPFLEASIRSLGKGKVDENKHQIQVKEADLPKITAAPPKFEAVARLLGSPYQLQKGKGEIVAIYRFEMLTPRIEKGFEDRKSTLIKFHYSDKTDDILKMSGKFAGLKISINFSKLRNSLQVPMEEIH